jgi:hypothetical protein
MPLSWSTLPDSQLCIVSGEGTVTRSDIYTYLARTIAEGAKSYAKLVDITSCTLALDSDDLDTVAHRLMQYGRGRSARSGRHGRGFRSHARHGGVVEAEGR